MNNNNNVFSESWNIFMNPSNFQTHINKFTKVNWNQWYQNTQEQNAQNIQHIQNTIAHNAQNFQQNLNLLWEGAHKNMSAHNIEEVVANQYEVFKQIAQNNIESFQASFSSMSSAASETYSNWANNFLEHLSKQMNSNNNQ